MGNNNTQVVIFYIHATINSPENNTADYIAATKSPYNNVYGTNNVKVDNTFDWTTQSGLTNQNTDRAEAAKNLTAHVENYIKNGIADGSIDVNKPLKIVLNGFSHGGNVNLQAAPEIVRLQTKYGIKTMSIDVNGYNTPQYYNNLGNTISGNNNPEDPAVVNGKVKRNSGNNVKLNHNSFYTKNDGVGGNGINIGGKIIPSASVGGRYPNNGVTRNFELTAPNTNKLNPIDVHGSPISDKSTRQQAAGKLHSVLINQKTKEDRAQRTTLAPSVGVR
jgi:hypothetical protein